MIDGGVRAEIGGRAGLREVSMLLDAKSSLLLVVDLQGSLMPVIFNGKSVAAVTNKLVSIARELEVPTVVTEHYPEGLKPTIAEVADHLAADYRPIEKRVFSCYGSKEFRRTLEDHGRNTLIIVGIETHICVLQTALQCLEAGYTVVVAVDGVGARSRLDHETALERMRHAGVSLVTWEMVAYEWMRRADTPAFKKVLPHIKTGLGPEEMTR
jgi:nicotinamidase-related amidase